MCVTKKSTKPSSKKTQLVENRRFSQSFRFACTGTEDRARHLSYLVQYGTGGLSSGEQMSGLNKLRLFARPCAAPSKSPIHIHLDYVSKKRYISSEFNFSVT